MIRTVQTFAGEIAVGDILINAVNQQCKIIEVTDLGGGRLKIKLSSNHCTYIWDRQKFEVVNLVIQEPIEINPDNDPSVHARRFREGSSRDFHNNREMNQMFIRCQEQYLNDLLQTRGHVFLNEAYDALGLERMAAGALVGWHVSNPGNIKIKFLDDKARNIGHNDFYLDFNVQGIIFNKLPGEWELYG